MIEKLIGRKFEVLILDDKVFSMTETESSARVTAAKECLAGIESWENRGKGDYERGICGYLPGCQESMHPLGEEAFQAWPEFSGSYLFPIPGKFAGCNDSADAWQNALKDPKRHYSYIQARGRLARHCRKYFEEIIAGEKE